MGWAARLNPRSRQYNKPLGVPWYKFRSTQQTVKEPINTLVYAQHSKVGVKMSLLDTIKDFFRNLLRRLSFVN